MYRIGIIEDDQRDLDDIIVSILDNISETDMVDFKEYNIERKSKEDLFEEIRTDIINDNLSALIVDYKLDTHDIVIEGSEIVEFMHEETPEFPTVILTNVPDDGKKSSVTDADKVYTKQTFLNPEKEETKQMVENILLNMKKYAEKRHGLEAKLDLAIKKMNDDPDNPDVTGEIMEIESHLAKYKQIYEPTVEVNFNLDKLKEAAELLGDFDKILGDKNGEKTV